MKIEITGKQFKVIPRLRAHIEAHLEKLSRYDSHIISAHVVLKAQKYINTVEITMHGSHFEFFGIGMSDENMFEAVDLAVYRVEAQLKKHRERFKEHNKRDHRRQAKINRTMDNAPQVIGSEAYSPEVMTLEEASAALDSSQKDFIVFFNSKTKKVNVLYEREDGHHSVVEPGV